ncbi:MAG TPA: hypothetical protein VFS40_14630 [Gemmatimonadales bacterium]|nr:hypothetical protein [Gemmatimonadales bacterium]
MARRLLALGLTALLLGPAACSDQSGRAPTSPSGGDVTAAMGTPAAAGLPTTPCTGTQSQLLTCLKSQAGDLFLAGNVTAARSKLDAIDGSLKKGKTANARDQAFDLIRFTLDRLQTTNLRGGLADETQTAVTVFVSGVYSLVGLPAPVIPPGALGPDGAAAVILPTTPDTAVVTGTKHGGIFIPTGSVTQPSLITIAPLPTPAVPLSGPLATPFDQYPLFYDFTVSPAAPPGVPDFQKAVTVAICHLDVGDGPYAPADQATEARLRIAHNVVDPQTNQVGAEVLPLAAGPFLDCSTLDSSTLPPSPPTFRAGRHASLLRSGWDALERRLTPALELLLPAEAHASAFGLCCLGGSTTKLSPFGAVDPGTATTGATLAPAAPTAQGGTAGRPVAALPAVSVTRNGLALPGVTVTFTGTTAGEALLVDAATGQLGSSASVVTNSDGIASLAGWSLGPAPGIHTVTATVAGATGSPVSFDVDVGGTTLQAEDPAQEGTLTSLNSNVATSIRFTNGWTQPIRVYWLGYTGTRDSENGPGIPYAELQPGQSFVQPTYVTHPWLVTSVNLTGGPDAGLAIYQPTAEEPAGTPNEANFTGPWTAPVP